MCTHAHVASIIVLIIHKQKRCQSAYIDAGKHDDLGMRGRLFKSKGNTHGKFKGWEFQKEPTHQWKGGANLDFVIGDVAWNQVSRCCV